MAPSGTVPRLSEAQEASLRNMTTFELTLWARMDKHFDDVAVLPPQLLPRNSGVDWEKPNQLITRLLSQLICVPLFQSHPQLIPVGLEIARYHRLCHFSTLHSATASTHPSIVSACQLMNEDAARIQLADAIRLATPLGEIFPSPPTSDFILKCKLSSIQIGSIHRGKHSLNKVAIITADLELLAEVWDSYALEVDAGEKSTEAYAKAENQLRISNIKQKLVQSKRQWMLSHLVDAPQDHVVFDGTEDEESEVGEIDGGQLFSSGNRAIIYENRASIPTAVATRKRPRQPSSSPTRNIRRQMSPRNVPSDAAPVKDLSQMSHEQLQNYEKEICSQLPLLQIEIRELREALDKKSWQKGELMARLAPVNQLLTYRPSQRSEIVTHHPTARDSQPSISTVNRESFSDMANQNDSAAPQQFGNEHGTNRISQALQPTKSPSHGGLSPQSGEKDTSMVRSLEDNSTQPKSIQPPTNAAESQLSGSFPSESEDFVLESIEKPHESLKLAYLQASLETSPQDKPDRRSVDQEAMNQTTPLQKREQSPVSELQTTPGTPQPKPAPNDEDTPEQPLYKAPIPTWDQSNMTAATHRQRFELVHYRLELWIEANPASSQVEIDDYFVRGIDLVLTQLQEESGKLAEEFAEARDLAKLEVLSIAEGFYNDI